MKKIPLVEITRFQKIAGLLKEEEDFDLSDAPDFNTDYSEDVDFVNWVGDLYKGIETYDLGLIILRFQNAEGVEELRRSY